MFNIKEELKKLPGLPGVYIMKDKNDEIIYVGKAINLKKRVSQYFQSSKNHTPKVRAMVVYINEFEYIITDSEIEALILECNLIKKHKPKYNVRLKDDKHYPYIKVTVKEEFPKIFVARKLKSDGAKYFGPYTSSFFVNNTIEIIKRIFPIRTCSRVFPRDIGKDRPCLNYYIKRCIGPCKGDVSKKEYNSMINEILMFLGGKHDTLLGKLEDQMKEYSVNLDFEQAAIVRDKINSIHHIFEKQKIISASTNDQDVIAFAKDGKDAVVQVFFVRGGKLLGREKFVLDGTEFTERNQILYEFIKQFYLITEYVPREILLQEEIDEASIIEKWLSEKRGAKVYIRVPKKGEKCDLIEMVHKNAIDALARLDSQKVDDNEKYVEILSKLQNALGLETIPLRIESYDISNMNGLLSVGSMITFINGKPDKSQYRRFKIKTVKGPNDYLSIQEILFRRFSKTDLYSSAPDLICIDGGKGHVNSAQKIINELGIDIKVCGLVKNDKHKTRGIIYNNIEYNFPEKDELLKFITNIQDEVHRFAITYQRLLREKQIKTSILDSIKGIGPKRKMILLNKYKNINNIKNASIEELMGTDGINKFTAEAIYYHFNK